MIAIIQGRHGRRPWKVWEGLRRYSQIRLCLMKSGSCQCSHFRCWCRFLRPEEIISWIMIAIIHGGHGRRWWKVWECLRRYSPYLRNLMKSGSCQCSQCHHRLRFLRPDEIISAIIHHAIITAIMIAIIQRGHGRRPWKVWEGLRRHSHN